MRDAQCFVFAITLIINPITPGLTKTWGYGIMGEMTSYLGASVP